MTEIAPLIIAFPLITGIIQVLKKTLPFVSGKEELVALVLGLVIVLFGMNEVTFQSVVTGLATGLASMGLYDVSVPTIDRVKKLM